MEGIGGVIKRRADDPKRKSQPKAGQLPGIEIPEVRAERYIYSQAHALAAEISSHFREREKFAVYLSIINRIGLAQARTAFASIKSGESDIRSPRKFFMWLARNSEESVKKAVPKPEKPTGKQMLLFKRVAKGPGK
jgi:hypothetical protein